MRRQARCLPSLSQLQKQQPSFSPPSRLPTKKGMRSRLRSAFLKGGLRHLDRDGIFYCPSCATWRRELWTRPNSGIDRIALSHHPRPLFRPTSTTPVRAISTTSPASTGKIVPHQFKELYDALSDVKDAALEQVSLSRLQLALRGLESEAPLIRVAGGWRCVW